MGEPGAAKLGTVHDGRLTLECGMHPSTKIGVSLLAVQRDMIGGLASYVRQLTVALCRRAPSRYLLFAPESLAGEWSKLLPPGALLEPVRLHNAFTVARALYEVVQLPRLARRRGCAVLFYPNTTAPIARTPAPVVALFDVMYRSQPHDTPWHKQLYLDFCLRVLRMTPTPIVTLSEFSRADIVRHAGIRAERIWPIPCGVDEIFFDRTSITGASHAAELPRGPYLLSVAAAYPHKRLPVVIEAFERIAVSHPDLTLVLAGTEHGGWEEMRRIATKIEQSPFAGRITRLPKVPWAAMPALYRGAAVLVHGSQYEGFGFPVAEAMASQVPVATAPAEAVIELLGPDGEIASGWGADDLARAITCTLQWPADVRARKIASASRRAAERYRWSAVAERVERVFAEAANAGRDGVRKRRK